MFRTTFCHKTLNILTVVITILIFNISCKPDVMDSSFLHQEPVSVEGFVLENNSGDTVTNCVVEYYVAENLGSGYRTIENMTYLGEVNLESNGKFNLELSNVNGNQTYGFRAVKEGFKSDEYLAYINIDGALSKQINVGISPPGFLEVNIYNLPDFEIDSVALKLTDWMYLTSLVDTSFIYSYHHESISDLFILSAFNNDSLAYYYSTRGDFCPPNDTCSVNVPF